MQTTAAFRWSIHWALPKPTVAGWEYRIALLGIGVIAAHVVDDNFLQPEPGAAAGDHLLSGLVPLALLALAAVAYGRLGAGLRATLALVVGALGAAMGAAEAGYYTATVGPSGDDYSGLLAIPAGLLLVALGSATLWRTRRSGGSRGRRYVRRAALGVLGVLTIFVVLLPIASAYVYTHAQGAIVPAPELGGSYEDVTFTTSDGLTLAGWYLPSKNGAAVIASPGRTGPQPHARMLARHGYGVLLFDRRGEGESEGAPSPWAGHRDLKAALAFLAARPDVDPARIGGLGLSVGGEMLLQTAAETPALRAVVSEGAGVRSIRESLERPGVGRWLTLPQGMVVTASMAVLSNHAPPPNLKDLVGRIAPRPVLLIYATHGMGGEELNPAYYAAAGEPKLLWEIGAGGHTDGLAALPEEYERRVIGFFDDALLDGR